jgi:hypothetical protein
MFHDHRWMKWKFTILVGTPKTKKQEEDWACSKREKKHLEPPYFQISYLHHFLFVLNNLKIYRSAIWRFTKPFWSAKTIEWHSKILSSKIQIGHMCQPTSCMWTPSLGKNISCSFFHWFEWFFFALDVPFEALQNHLGSAKIIKWRPKILSCRIQTSHMCQPTSCPWPPSLAKGISCSFLHRFEELLLHKMR